MKRFIAVLSGLLIMPAFAEVAPVYYDDTTEYSDDVSSGYDVSSEQPDVVAEDVQPVVNPVIPAVTVQNKIISRAASRAVPSIDTVSSRNSDDYTASRGTTAQRSISNRARSNASTTVSRTVGQNVTSRRNTVGSDNSVRAATLTQSDTVNTPLYTGRVGVRSVATVSRAPTMRAATASAVTTSSANASTGPSMDEIAQMTDYCKAQYTQCMDNFCSVLDDNQGRCSCSSNIKNYAKTEDGLKQATSELQDVAQKIQYIGLTKDEISTLFTQTAAEAAMQGKSDTTQLKTDLDKVKNLIFDVKSGTSVASDGTSTLDLSSLLNFSSDNSGFDLNSLFGTTNTSSISNQRGAELYKTATSRCKAAVLDSCKSQGVDTTILTNSYDLEIDKQCIVYERSLSDANEQMTSTVRNAKSVLQKARLAVAQQKNSYDMRGCINALDTCMQDEFVCGSDYENCLDPTGKYIVNGKVVNGGDPGVSGGGVITTSGTKLYATWNYATGSNNAWGTGTLGEYIANSITAATPVSNMVVYLQSKIGYNDSTDGKNYGMCMSVLNKCQDATYTGNNNTFNKSNDVIKGYLQRTLTQIKASQDEVLSKYGENCTSDVSSCLSSNGYSSTATTVIKNAAINACNSSITTCASVTGTTQADVITAATTTN